VKSFRVRRSGGGVWLVSGLAVLWVGVGLCELIV